MPKRNQERMKRQLGHAWGNFYRAQEHLNTLRLAFSETHPQHAELLEQIMMIAEMGISLCKDFGLLAWNYVPEDPEVWRCTNQDTAFMEMVKAEAAALERE